MAEFWSDARFGLRLLAKSPVFALTATLLLGIGIGANTLIFSIVDALLLRPLPVPNPHELVRLVEAHPNQFLTWAFPYAVCEQMASPSASLSEAFCQGDLDAAFEHGETVERVRVNAVSGNFFSSLGLTAYLGRVLTPDDDRARAMHAVVSYDFWQRRLGGARAAIGQSVRLNGMAFTVIGVLPEGVNGLTVETNADVRIPLSTGRWLAQKVAPPELPSDYTMQFQVFGRLRKGVQGKSAEAEMEPRLQAAYEESLIRSDPSLAKSPRKDLLDSRLRLESAAQGVSTLRTLFWRGLVLLLGLAGLLLLMACANVACLLLARGVQRRHEISLRLALGASGWRVARQLLTESLVLGLGGGAFGLALTYLGRPLLLAALPPVRDRSAVLQPLAVHIAVDWSVLGFAVAVSVATALVSGLLPALRGAGENLAGTVRGSRGSRAGAHWQRGLVAAQVALCVVLLAGAGLLVRTFERMRTMDAGFDRDHIVTFTLDPSLKGYSPERAKALSRQLLDKARALPDVVGAAIAERGLMRGTGVKATFGLAGTPLRRSDFLNCSLNGVTPGYFEAMGMRVLAGRDFTWLEGPQSKPRRVVVNEAFVKRFLPGQSALGRLVGSMGRDGVAEKDNQVIGVVSDAKYRSLREDVPPTVYSPVTGGFDSSFILHLRTRGQPSATVAGVREALRTLAPGLPFVEVRTLREEVETSLWQERLLAWLSTWISLFAALLAGIGLYGALDGAVRARTREIGIRIAVGANQWQVARLLLAETAPMVVAGAACGVALLALAGQWTRQVLYGVTPWDTGALAAALLLIGAVALAATAVPARRAMRIDPAGTLRDE